MLLNKVLLHSQLQLHPLNMKLEIPKNNGSYVKTEPRKTFPSRTYLQFSFPQKAVFSRFPFETKNRIAISCQDSEIAFT